MDAVIFDMDGVLIDSEPLHFQLETAMFGELGIQTAPGEHESFLGTNSHEMFSRLKARYGLDQSVAELVADERRRYMEALSNRDLPLMEGIPRLVARLAENGFRLAVASSAPHEQIRLVMDRSGLGEFFSVRVSGDDVPKAKPDPAVFRLAIEKLGIDSRRCWVIEDSENGILAATGAGARCIGFANPGSGRQNLTGARFVIDTIEEAERIILPEASD